MTYFYPRLISFLVILTTFALGGYAYAQRGAPVHKVVVDGSVINVHYYDKLYDLPKEQILGWIKTSAEAVRMYYGQFSLKKTNIYMYAGRGRGISGGQAFSGPRPYIRLYLGVKTGKLYLKRDWVMVHEMIHLAFPQIAQKHNWLTEGLAVYVESIARLQAGHISRAQAWGSLVKGMPNGVPRYGDRGLDHTPTWGRTYWGGAIFCLVADIEIRKQTKGKMGLQHALRAVLKAGGNFSTYSSIEHALATGDKATGTTVLIDLYNDWKAKPVDPDLKGLWKKLGISVQGRHMVFRDDAELADIREQIGRRME